MALQLTHRFLGLAVLGTAFMLGGTILSRPELAALGAALLVALSSWRVHVRARTARLVRGGLEVASRVEASGPVLRPHDSFRFRHRIRVHPRCAVGAIRLEVDQTAGLRIDPCQVTPPVGAECEVTAAGRAVAVGKWHLGGVHLTITDPLGLTRQSARVSNRTALTVVPKAAPTFLAATTSESGFGQAHRRSGSGFDLKEIRPWTPGDPFRRIAWKPTARTGHLMVRELQEESRTRHHLALDFGSDLRLGEIGSQAVDEAVAATWSFALAAFRKGEPVGLSTLDGRLVSNLRSACGPLHQTRLLQALLYVHCLVDADRCVATDSEVIEIMAHQLRRQRGIELRVDAPQVGSPDWAHLVVAADGSVYDRRDLGAAVRRELAAAQGIALPIASTPEQRLLRRLAQEWGLVLGPPVRSTPTRRHDGLLALFKEACTWPTCHELTVLVGSLDIEVSKAFERALSHAARRHRMRILAPDTETNSRLFENCGLLRVERVEFRGAQLLRALSASSSDYFVRLASKGRNALIPSRTVM